MADKRTVFLLTDGGTARDNPLWVVSIHATRESAERAMKEYLHPSDFDEPPPYRFPNIAEWSVEE